ncbi:HtaA domain-containing protein [Microbacterium sp.]|uniref:HtaA domain-containing protein n=1 Tax=Microbacterium sp. TaxID=51671 RepID=UPI0039E3E1BE
MTSGGELRWAVKDSFIRYVRVIAAGTTQLDDGAAEAADGAFTWPLASASRDDGQLDLRFSGSVRFTAHGGYLDVDLRDPWLLLSGDSGSLSISPAGGDGRLVIATMNPSAEAAADDALVPLLTAAGAELFGSVYATGTAFAPLTASIRLNS